MPNKWRDEGVKESQYYWRMLYTLDGDKVKIIAFILEVSDYDDYNKLMNYKKK